MAPASAAASALSQGVCKLLELNDLLLRQFDEKNFNCWHLCQQVSQRMGQKLIGFNAWVESIAQRDLTIRSFEKDFERLQGPEPGSIVVFARNHKTVVHMGIVMEDCKSFIHIGRRTCTPRIERLDNPTYARVLYGFYRYAKPSENTQSVR